MHRVRRDVHATPRTCVRRVGPGSSAATAAAKNLAFPGTIVWSPRHGTLCEIAIFYTICGGAGFRDAEAIRPNRAFTGWTEAVPSIPARSLDRIIGAQENKQLMSRSGRLGNILIIVTAIRGRRRHGGWKGIVTVKPRQPVEPGAIRR
jgi:hypothetical protein